MQFRTHAPTEMKRCLDIDSSVPHSKCGVGVRGKHLQAAEDKQHLSSRGVFPGGIEPFDTQVLLTSSAF